MEMLAEVLTSSSVQSLRRYQKSAILANLYLFKLLNGFKMSFIYYSVIAKGYII